MEVLHLEHGLSNPIEASPSRPCAWGVFRLLHYTLQRTYIPWRKPVQLSQKSALKELVEFSRTLRTLNSAVRRLVPILSSAISTKGAHNGNDRARRPLSAKARASMVLQGRYMGYMRQLKPRQKAQVRKIREVKGIGAAITRASELAAAAH